MKNNSKLSIQNLSSAIQSQLHRDSTLLMSDGTMVKLTDSSKLHSLGWHHSIELKEGIEKIYLWYLNDVVNDK